MPKPYLYKLHVLLGYSSKQIAELHKKKLGFSVSERLVRDYLNKYEIYRPAPTKEEEKKRKKIMVGSRCPNWDLKKTRKAVEYLNHRLFLRRGVKPFVDSISNRYRKETLNKFFRSVAKKKKITRGQSDTLRFIFQSYEMTPSVIDLFFPNRYVILDWVKLEEIRKGFGLSKRAFARKIKVDNRCYFKIQKKEPPKLVRRSTIFRIADNCEFVNPSHISKEIIKWKTIL